MPEAQLGMFAADRVAFCSAIMRCIVYSCRILHVTASFFGQRLFEQKPLYGASAAPFPHHRTHTGAFTTGQPPAFQTHRAQPPHPT